MQSRISTPPARDPRDLAATQTSADQAMSNEQLIGTLNEHSITEAPSNSSTLTSLGRNIWRAIANSWSGNSKYSPDYRSTIFGSTYAERNILQQHKEKQRQGTPEERRNTAYAAAMRRMSEQPLVRKTAPNSQPSPPVEEMKSENNPDDNTSSNNPATTRRDMAYAAAMRRMPERPLVRETAPSSQPSLSSSVVRPHAEEMKLENNSNHLSQPLLTRMNEISDSLDLLPNEIETQN